MIFRINTFRRREVNYGICECFLTGRETSFTELKVYTLIHFSLLKTDLSLSQSIILVEFSKIVVYDVTGIVTLIEQGSVILVCKTPAIIFLIGKLLFCLMTIWSKDECCKRCGNLVYIFMRE